MHVQTCNVSLAKLTMLFVSIFSRSLCTGLFVRSLTWVVLCRPRDLCRQSVLLFSEARQVEHVDCFSLSPVSIIQTGHHHHMMAPLSGDSASSGALFRNNNRRVHANAIVILAPSGANFRSL